MGSFNLVDQSALFKEKYTKRSQNMYNSENVLQGRIKKLYNFTGRQDFVQTNLSFSGGVGAGRLPKANAGKYEGAIITAKRVYATAVVEREAIYASKNDEGAFVRATAETVKKTVESHMRNASRILFGDGSSILGRGDGTTNVTGTGANGDPYVVVISAASWKEFNWEERDYVQHVSTLAAFPANTGGAAEGGQTETNLLEVVEVVPALRTVKLEGSSPALALLTGVGPVLASSGFCMQKSYGVEPTGIKSVFDITVAATGNLYNIPYQRRWSAFVKDAGGQGITPDLMNLMMLQVKKKSGKFPNMIMSGFEQSRNLKNFMEDQKVYNLPNRNLKGAPGFQGIEFVSDNGAIGIFIERFADEDKLYFLNDDFIACHHRPGFGWFDDDGTVFLRVTGEDEYEARYGGYYDNFITPTFHGILYNLAVE